MTAETETDAAIVGCGPVGQVLAILLGQRGRRVRVLERWPSPYPLPRAVHVDHEVSRILQATGIADVLAPYAEPASRYEWRNAAGDLLLQIGRDGSGGLSGWPESTMICQPELERILDHRLRELPSVSIERGVEVLAAHDEADGVVLDARSADGRLLEVRAQYAVGCDGANSVMRGALGSGWTDLGFHFDWLVIDLIPAEPRVWDPPNCQLCDPARPTTLVSGGPGRRRFEFMRLPHETLEALNDEATAWRLLAPFGFTQANAKLERHAVYTFRACWADVWRSGRRVIAGDAAHLMPPFAGQGLCSGLRDAANLAWKLDLVLAGSAGEALLDSYASERIPNVRAAIDFSIALGRVICVADPAEAAERDRRMIAEARARSSPIRAVQPPLGPGCLAEGSPAAGRLFVQDRVEQDGRAGRFDDVVGRGFVLASPHGDPGWQLDAELARWFESVGGVTAHVAPGAPVEDLSGGYARWFEAEGAGVVLQRPDFYVFGTAPTIDGAGALIEALRGNLRTGLDPS